MKIYPSFDKIDEFVIHLTSQELQNIKQGLLVSMKNTPWGKWTDNAIDNALNANNSYRSLSWE